eukprot:TRINITY_DN4729_c0_g4_i1.p1 TRINITY_DN4729_c0_g4~~TRINITY_DN4729_c0_g4_i1.p1  ORF type:complete len:1023 (-),score=284.50 TRINITY_DN4729_c0_g4_i1:134-3040(-)
MEVNEQTLNNLFQLLQDSTDTDQVKRRQAESSIKQAERQPGFSILLLRALEVTQFPPVIKQVASIVFKNLIKTYWPETDSSALPTNDREIIKSTIVTLMLSATQPQVTSQLSAALEIISQYDFPLKWPNLLPELVSKLNNSDTNFVIKALSTVNSVLKRYRHAVKAEESLVELKKILEDFQEPLLRLFTGVMGGITNGGQNHAALVPSFEAVRLMAKIFYALNAVDLPEYFEDHLGEWMSFFHTLLIFESKEVQLVGDEDDSKAGLLYDVQAAVCQNVNLYASKYEEEFQPYHDGFLQDIWTLLTRLNAEPRYDSLAVSAIQILTSMATGVHHQQFRQPLQTICEQIAIPNLKLREIEVEMFEDDPIEFIRRDVEGNDNDTRRRAATELIKGLRKYFAQETTAICTNSITQLLKSYTENPTANWASKDVSIYLVPALAVRTATAAQGTTAVNELVPIMEFFQNHVYPELSPSNSASQILRADALKYVWTFRQQMPKETYNAIFPSIIQNLKSNSYVIHTYAALCIDKLLTVKDVGNIPRFGNMDIKPHLGELLTILFGALQTDNHKENEYTMKTIMRVCQTAKEDIIPFGQTCIDSLVAVFARIYRNPVNAHFNHYLFESLAILCKIICKSSPNGRNQLETLLFPIFLAILNEDIQEFEPYVFQILSLILESNSNGISANYFQLLPPLLTPLLWDRSPNIPPLVRLLQAYLHRGSDQIITNGQLPVILGIFQAKLMTPKNDHEGFNLLNSITTYLTAEQLATYWPGLLGSVIQRIGSQKTTKVVTGLLVFLSKFILRHGVSSTIQRVNSIGDPALFGKILSSLWVQDISKISDHDDRKIATVASVRLLVDPNFHAEPFLQYWVPVLDNAISLTHKDSDDSNNAEDEILLEEHPELGGAQFSPLSFATKPEEDLTQGVHAKKLLATELYRLFHQTPGKFPPLLANLSPEKGNLLQQLFVSAELRTPYFV